MVLLHSFKLVPQASESESKIQHSQLHEECEPLPSGVADLCPL